MVAEMRMPKMGQSMEEGTVLSWERRVGERIANGEALCAIESDKARIEVESPVDGTVRRILVEEGETVPVGTLIAIIGEAAEDISGVAT